ncbi:HpcH/HpaI aldolase family protein [Aureliella helgolandensis]|uniref:4-hydroxy-2-oxovalerate aldolase n=1 Tax=Aureliella helgolandensis TaxID=2527968 RepID=A0A518GH27_9BACT|nr:aldolase/citrate lyase family protein [Aureliella helgolandensis]QDV27887.1 4-hydroxy-2-oxovalerate aldolase [Aureliella helgolandensis]
MKSNPIKKKLSRGQPTLGTWLSLGNLHAARVLARSGFDWITLDIEHSPFDWREIASVVASIADADCVPLLRVPDNSHTMIKWALDAGAYGVIVPMIDTVEQAQAAISAAKYPPRGTRSAGGGMHNLNFSCPTEEYYRRANDEVVVILQTESPQGVANAEQIYAVPGCDAVFIGPNDLRFQMRSPTGDFPTAEEHEQMIQRVVEAGRATSTPVGIHVMTPEQANARIAEGMQFIAISSDLGMLANRAAEIVKTLGIQSDDDIARY